MSYVVTGATGQVGSAVIRYLSSKSLPVRAVVRSKEKAESLKTANIDAVVADLNDVQALTEAFKQAKGVFLMNPPAYESEDMHLLASSISKTFETAVRAANVSRIVILSSIGAERTSDTGNILTTHVMENTLKNAAAQVIVIRPAWFMENWKNSILAIKSGHSTVLGSMLQKLDRSIPQVATDDIGQVIADYLTRTDFEVNENLIVELEGPEAYSPNEIARIVSDALGRNVLPAAMSEEMIRFICDKHGCSQKSTENWLEMVRAFDDGTISWLNQSQVIRCKGKRSMQQVVRDILNSQ